MRHTACVVAACVTALTLSLVSPPQASAGLLDLFRHAKEFDRRGLDYPKDKFGSWLKGRGASMADDAFGESFTRSGKAVNENRGFLQRTFDRAIDPIKRSFDGESVDTDDFFEAVRKDVTGTATRVIDTQFGFVTRPVERLRSGIRQAADDVDYLREKIGQADDWLAPGAAPASPADEVEADIAQGMADRYQSFAEEQVFDRRSVVVVGEGEEDLFEQHSTFLDDADQLPEVLEDEFLRYEVESRGFTMEDIVYADPADDPFALEKADIYEREAFVTVVDQMSDAPDGWENIDGDVGALPADWEDEVPAELIPEGWAALSEALDGDDFESHRDTTWSPSSDTGTDDSFVVDDLDASLDSLLTEAVAKEREVPVSNQLPGYQAGAVREAAQAGLDTMRQRTASARERANRAARQSIAQLPASDRAGPAPVGRGVEEGKCPVDWSMSRCCAAVRADLGALHQHQRALSDWQRQTGYRGPNVDRAYAVARQGIDWANDFIAQNCG